MFYYILIAIDSSMEIIQPKRKRIVTMSDSSEDENPTSNNNKSQENNSDASGSTLPKSDITKRTVQEREQMVRYLMKKFNTTESFVRIIVIFLIQILNQISF